MYKSWEYSKFKKNIVAKIKSLSEGFLNLLVIDYTLSDQNVDNK